MTLAVSRIRYLEVVQDHRGMPHSGETACIPFSHHVG